ncbi:hypothetical protein [Streptomyces albipurpureus]|uniref:Uncharacterized protein n=1 Tax=Streptomyces albipurpureus TaxID=2897419 RepID=A0ABT0UQ81_9ACTN|nr:hypothetical protein [Streptomyces sp. CWNU-1]MCM2390614.1 hypothetical protein [Streptomyces sp. CWNU-1]
MSRTVPVSFGDRLFWAYDVGLGVLFAEAVRIAEKSPGESRPPWWGGLVRQLRVHAVVGASLAVALDELSVEERGAVLGWVADAGAALTARGGVSLAEVSRWNVLDGESIHLRGARHVAPGPLVELGQAMSDLVDNALPPAPEGRYWTFGTPDGRVIQGG